MDGACPSRARRACAAPFAPAGATVRALTRPLNGRVKAYINSCAGMWGANGRASVRFPHHHHLGGGQAGGGSAAREVGDGA